MKLTTCQVCGSEVGDAKFCKNCGSAVKKEEQTNNANSNNAGGKFCSQCGKSIDINAMMCPYCGAEQNSQPTQEKQTKFCSNCGEEIDSKAVVCPKCGVQVQNASITQELNPTVAILLNFFIPGLGHIYSGLTQKGILILVLYIVSAILTVVVVGFVLALIIWVWALIDVNKCVKALNAGEHVEDKLF